MSEHGLRKYRVPVAWTVWAHVDVLATNKADAKNKVDRMKGDIAPTGTMDFRKFEIDQDDIFLLEGS